MKHLPVIRDGECSIGCGGSGEWDFGNRGSRVGAAYRGGTPTPDVGPHRPVASSSRIKAALGRVPTGWRIVPVRWIGWRAPALHTISDRPQTSPGSIHRTFNRGRTRHLDFQRAAHERKRVINVPFSSFGLHADLLRGVQELGFTRPTPIQNDAIPPAVAGKDVLACAMTGSGKSAAFLLPILNKLIGKKRGTTRALILTPTRELAAQIDEHLRDLAVHTPLSGAAVY